MQNLQLNLSVEKYNSLCEIAEARQQLMKPYYWQLINGLHKKRNTHNRDYCYKSLEMVTAKMMNQSLITHICTIVYFMGSYECNIC